MKKFFYATIFGFVGLLLSCGEHNPNCQKVAKLHVAEKKYLDTHIKDVGKVKVFVENSGSMDGYVNGNTEFKTDLFNILKLLGDTNVASKYFINSEIIDSKLDDSEFSNGMSVNLFQKKGGNRETSNIAELIEKIIERTDTTGMSVFISDCVFDPQNNPDIEKRLGQQKTIIQTAIKRKLKNDKAFGVVVYRLMSSFSGYYYNKVKPHTCLNNVQRPYFVWLLGDVNRLKKAREVLKKDLENRTGNNIFVRMNKIDNLPYYCPSAKCNLARGKHIDEPKLVNDVFTFNVKMDFSSIPLDEKYLLDLTNYELPQNPDYTIMSVKKCKDKGGKYTHEIKIKKYKGNVKNNTLLHIVLKQPKCSGWVVTFNDSKGEDFMNGIHNNARTFGLKSYLDGVSAAYPDNIANFDILIK